MFFGWVGFSLFGNGDKIACTATHVVGSDPLSLYHRSRSLSFAVHVTDRYCTSTSPKKGDTERLFSLETTRACCCASTCWCP